MKKLLVGVVVTLVVILLVAPTAFAAPPSGSQAGGQDGVGCQGLAAAIVQQHENTGTVDQDLVQKYVDRGCASDQGIDQGLRSVWLYICYDGVCVYIRLI